MLADLLGNKYSFEQVQKVLVSDQWNSTCFVCFFVAQFAAVIDYLALGA